MNENETATLQASILVYDIPKSCKLDHPSSYLWRHGARINLSAWIVPNERLPLLPTAEWTMAGVRWRVARFDSADSENILALATESLMERVAAKRASLDAGIQDVEEAYAEAARMGGAEREVRLDYADRVAYRHLLRARDALEQAHECALAFGITGRVERAFEGLRKLTTAREALYWQMARDARGQSTTAEPGLPLQEAAS